MSSPQTEDPLQEMIDAHWSYVEGVLRVAYQGCGIDPDKSYALKEIGFHYKSAFRHGYKHAKNEMVFFDGST